MTPAEKVGLKVGDKIRVLSVKFRNDFYRDGDILTLNDDDYSNNPFFLREDEVEVAFTIDEDFNKWEKINMTAKLTTLHSWDFPDVQRETDTVKGYVVLNTVDNFNILLEEHNKLVKFVNKLKVLTI